MGNDPRASGDAGFTSIQFVVAVALSLLFTAGLLDVAISQSGAGAIGSALEAGARAGSRVGATPTQCRETATRWLDDLLGGTRGDGVTIGCTENGGVVRASASVTWDAWLPGVPDWNLQFEAVRPREGP